MRLADVLVEVLRELGGDNKPIHRSRIIPLAEKRWRDLGHVINGDFGQEISSAIQEYSSNSKKWRKKASGEDLFEMHKVRGKDGYYSLRAPTLDQL
jgi:hypothetical protein